MVEGCRLPVRMHGTEEWPLAEIISIKEELGIIVYYVHYVDFNKRLDEWVLEDDLDTRKVQFPRKDGLTTGQNTTGVSTPKRLISTSRPTSPVHHQTPDVQVNGSAVLAAALQKKINRKRKTTSISAPPLTPSSIISCKNLDVSIEKQQNMNIIHSSVKLR